MSMLQQHAHCAFKKKKKKGQRVALATSWNSPYQHLSHCPAAYETSIALKFSDCFQCGLTRNSPCDVCAEISWAAVQLSECDHHPVSSGLLHDPRTEPGSERVQRCVQTAPVKMMQKQMLGSFAEWKATYLCINRLCITTLSSLKYLFTSWVVHESLTHLMFVCLLAIEGEGYTD